MELPYSYHSFILPVQCDCGSIFQKSVNRSINNRGNWKPVSTSRCNDSEMRNIYKMYHFFTPEALKLLNPKEPTHSLQYLYDIPNNKDRSFIIRKKDYNRQLEEFRLIIHAIRATVFQNNIVILQLELENHEHCSIDVIKKINQYGRYINLPLLTEGFNPLVPDYISIMGNEVYFNLFGENNLLALTNNAVKERIIPPICDLLSELQLGDYLMPVYGDRMFVCCLIRNDELSNSISSICNSSNTENNIASLCNNDSLSDLLYSLAYVDTDSSSCQSTNMRNCILERCVYDRWGKWGTIDIITQYSFICITGESEYLRKGVIDTFNMLYKTTALSIIVQRATLLILLNECSKISTDYFSAEASKKKQLNAQIRQLKRDYVYAQNNILIKSITTTIQGTEETRMLRTALEIDELLEDAKEKINVLYDFSIEYSNDKENGLLNMLTKIGLPLSLIQTLAVIVSFSCFSDAPWWIQTLWLSGICLTSIIVSIIGFFIYSRSNNHTK